MNDDINSVRDLEWCTYNGTKYSKMLIEELIGALEVFTVNSFTSLGYGFEMFL